jgi:glycine/D-amino acid oxidase-like deaminating enzyme
MGADVIAVGAGLAGLVAAGELVERCNTVLVAEQENAANLGGQTFWSFGKLFFVDSPTRIVNLVIRSCVTGVLDGRVHQEPQRPADRRFTNGVDVAEPAPQESGEFFGFDGGHRQAVWNRREP